MYIFLSFRRISIIPEKCSWVEKFKNNLDYNGKEMAKLAINETI